MSNFRFGAISTLRMKGLKPQLIKLLDLMLIETTVDFGIAFNGGFRTAEQQNEIYRTKAGATTKDGFRKKSAHQSGMAVDLLPYIDGKVDISEKHYDTLRIVFEKCAKDLNLKTKPVIDWDKNHFQLET